MRIAFFWNNGRADPWVKGFQDILPQAEIVPWKAGDTKAGEVPADYAVVWAPSQAFLDAQPKLKGIFNMGAGVDALLKLRLPANVPVVRLDDAGMSVQMAEYVCQAVIRHFRELDAYEADARAGKWTFRKPNLRADFPVGIMGLGVLGERVAKALTAFEFPVLGWSRTAKVIDGVQCFAGEAQFNDFLAATRVLVCLMPLTPQTTNIMNRDTLSRLKPEAFVVNVARGAHLVEEDLLALLESGHVTGATLDVFRTEPLPAGHAFWSHPRITITPHTSARTLREETIAQIAGKIAAMERGEFITGVVDLSRGY